jgi:hypothetical protein
MPSLPDVERRASPLEYSTLDGIAGATMACRCRCGREELAQRLADAVREAATPGRGAGGKNRYRHRQRVGSYGRA